MREQTMWRIAILSLLVPMTAFGGFRVSTVKKDAKRGDSFYGAPSAIDNSPDTAWIVDPEAENVGQWIEIDLPIGQVDKVAVMIGWESSDKAFKDHSRIKTARVDLYTQADAEDTGTHVAEHPLSFEDKRGWQVIDIPDTAVGSDYFGGKLRLTVTEVYEGLDYPYLAVSEVLVHLKEIEAATTFREEPATSQGEHLPIAMLDRDKRSYWASESAESPASFRVEADGFGLSGIGIHPGPATHARPKVVELSTGDAAKTVTLENSGEMQWFALPSLIGYTGSTWGAVEVKVVETYPGSKASGVAISEVQLKATNYEGL